MKTILVILGIIFATFIAIQLLALNSHRNIETYQYSVNKKYNTFEIRSYEPTLFTSIKLSTKGYRKSSKKGFSILAEYIFGGNDRNEKISMTSPVTMKLEDSMTVMFMVPKKIKKEMLPKPNKPLIEFIEEPKKTVAVISFSGWANEKKIEKYKQKLKLALEAKEIAYNNQFYFLGYNAPYEVFNRKNEIMVELHKDAFD